MSEALSDAERWLSAGGTMGELVRAYDWASTPLGPISSWPQSLVTIASTCLRSRFPFLIWWGAELTAIYNDAYIPIFANKHPAVLGKPGNQVWGEPEVWAVIGPMLHQVLEGGPATWSEDQLLLLHRRGFLEETYFTWSYSPIVAEGGAVGGVLTSVTEVSKKVLGERRLRTLRELSAKSSDAKAVADVLRAGEEVLAENRLDVPFAFVLLLDPKERRIATRAATVGPFAGTFPERISLDAVAHPFLDAALRALDERRPVDLACGELGFVPDAFPALPHTAVAIPMVASDQDAPMGVVVVGTSARLALDEDYRGFLGLVAAQLATSLAAARSYETERERADRLAELDRAKTTFFSNVSHEFRTPLTLILGPLEETLRGELPEHARLELDVVHRNSLRLLKLVNTLLDFSRIEAGRVQATYEPTDLAALTRDLASGFRSAIERAGLGFVVDCPPLDTEVPVDRDMWEKIVLNLVSNAFKYTLAGEIGVTLRRREDEVELEVRDTGCGIAEHELPHVFDRFHRVEGARGRTHEGTGIGLALVQELVRLHGGTVRATSRVDEGSTFRVTVPVNAGHLVSGQFQRPRTLTPTPTRVDAFVAEALRWLPEAADEAPTSSTLPGLEATDDVTAKYAATSGARIVLADDNADMREYVERLLGTTWRVEAVADGAAALDAIRRDPPELVVTDVMMPRLDGFGLLSALRADPIAKAIPVIVLSARAGEESRVEGMEAGADDYLVKPFSARELVARVGAHLELARVRRESGRVELALRQEAQAAHQEVEAVLESMADGFYSVDAEWRIRYLNAAAERFNGLAREAVIGKTVWEVFPATVGTSVEELYRKGMLNRTPERLEHIDPILKRWFEVDVYPAAHGTIAIFFRDVHERRAAAAERERLLAELQEADRRKDEFLAVLSHELRSPLNVIAGHAELLLHEQSLPSRASKSLDAILRNTKAQTQLIADLLDVSRIITGKFLLDVSDFDLEAVLGSAMESVRFAAEAKGVSLVADIEGSVGHFFGDPTRIQQVVWNLLANAVKFTPRGGSVMLAAARIDSRIELVVTDTGLGIGKDFLPHVFDRFHQEDASKTRRYGGLGLGLSIVRHVTELHGGHVTAESAGPNQGSTFRVVLPIRSVATALPAAPRNGAPPSERAAISPRVPFAGFSILVVDDQEDARDMIAQLLVHRGADVVTVGSGAEALARLEARRFDLMLSDVGMPELNGLELLARWRDVERARKLPPIPAIALTAYATGRDRDDALAAGYQVHLTKPVRVAELYERVGMLLPRR